MEIDWLTVTAQIVNFLVLVFLLQRFLYRPIVAAMDRREARIAARLAEADAKAEEAEGEAGRYRALEREIQAQREDLVGQARSEAEELRRRLEAESRDEIEGLRAAWRRQVDEERDGFLRRLRNQAAEQFSALARRALADLANADLEAQVATVFIDRLGRLDDRAKRDVADAGRESGEGLVIASAFELPPALRGAITRAIHREIADGIDVRYLRSGEIACGIELRAAGRSIVWGLDGYLDNLQERLSSALETPGPAPDDRRVPSVG
jgi:F-type H+-transporting ATPase subunit b